MPIEAIVPLSRGRFQVKGPGGVLLVSWPPWTHWQTDSGAGMSWSSAVRLLGYPAGTSSAALATFAVRFMASGDDGPIESNGGDELDVTDPIFGPDPYSDDVIDGVDDSLFSDTDVIEASEAQLVGITVLLSQIATKIPWLVPIIRGVMSGLSKVRLQWSEMPRWLQLLLQAAGVGVGAEIVNDLVDEDPGISIGPLSLPIGGGSGGGSSGGGVGDPVATMVQAMTVSTWNANGVQFHRLSDGRLAVRNKHGVWKVWRPKKPRVIFSTGPTNLQDFLAVDKILDKQAKKMATSLRRRGYKVAQK